MIGLSLFGALSASAMTDAARPINELFREHWTTRDGLAHNSINSITQTPEGYLWLATWEGLIRFNGREFALFDRSNLPGLPDAALRALHIDAEGRLVVGGARGSLMRRGNDGRWEKLAQAPVMVANLAGDATSGLLVGIQTSGVLRLGPDGPAQLLQPADGADIGSNFDFTRDAKGRWWAGHAGGLHRIDRSTLIPVEATGLPTGPANAVIADGERLLVGTADGVFIANIRDNAARLAFRPLDPALAGVNVTRLLPDRHGGYWIGTLEEGLMRWSTAGLDRLGIGPDRPNSRILSLFVDREDTLWVGTNSGLFRFTDAPFSNVLRKQGLPDDYVRSVLAQADGSVLIGTAQGLARHRSDGSVEVLGTDTLLKGRSVLSLADAGDGKVWVGTYDDGLLLWNERRVLEHIDVARGLPANEVRAVVADGDIVWIGTTRGLARWDGRSLQTWTNTQGLPSNFVIALHLDHRRRLWVGTGHGAAIFDGTAFKALDLAAFEDAEYAFSFAADTARGKVWVASDRGLLRFDSDGRATGAVGLAQGLPFEKVFGLLFDPEGQAWASGNRGILRMDLAQLNASADSKEALIEVERFTEVDGLASAQGNGGSQPVIALDREDRIWVATSIGATRVHPDDLLRYTRNAPPVIIESVLADGQTLLLGDAALVVPAGTRRLEVRFAALSFVLPERLRYRYRLEGFDDDWVERDGESFAEFTSLRPGRYRFHVESAHPRGEWGESGTSIEWIVLAQWWQRPQVFWALVLAALTLATLLLRWHLRRLSANEQYLARLVDERTLEIQAQKLQLHQQAEEFARQAREDALTGLGNRRAFDEALEREFARARRSGAPLSVVVVDIDHFKQVNDQFSHAAGDEVLRRVAALLKAESRGFDIVARWGGEEFTLLLPETTLAAARSSCERLRERIMALDLSDIDPALRITASFGIADAEGVDNHQQLLHRADQALYRAKAEGRNRVVS